MARLYATSKPPVVCSVNDDNIYTLVSFTAGFLAPINTTTQDSITGLAILKLDNSGTPTAGISIGDTIILTDGGGSVYTGSWAIMKIIDPLRVMINCPFISSDSTNYYSVFHNLTAQLITYTDHSFTTPIRTVANIKININPSSVAYINISEYLKSEFKINVPINAHDSVGESIIFYKLVWPQPVVLYSGGANETDTGHIMFNSEYSNTDINTVQSTQIVLHNGKRIIFPQFLTPISCLAWIGGTVHTDTDLTSVYEIIESSSYNWSTPLLLVSGQYFQANSNIEIFAGCYQDAINIVFLNEQGGWQNYVLSNEYKYETTFAKVNQYKKPNRSDRFSLIESNQMWTYNLKNVRVSHTDSIEAMIKSVQAYICNADGSFTPIMIDKKSFIIYETFRPYINATITFTSADSTFSQLN